MDITRIPGLGRNKKQGNTLILGSLVTHAQAAASSATCAVTCPLWQRPAAWLVHPRFEMLGPWWETLCRPSPVPMQTLPLHIYDTQVGIVGRGGERNMALPELYLKAWGSAVWTVAEN